MQYKDKNKYHDDKMTRSLNSGDENRFPFDKLLDVFAWWGWKD
jgi:hypothetical protein